MHLSINKESNTDIINKESNTDIIKNNAFSLEEREAVIREIAYYRYEKGGYACGHDLDDWLAAEAEFEERIAKS